MGASKLHIHSDECIQVAAVAKVFAHPARVAIIDFLSKGKNKNCLEIAEEIGLAQPTITQHLTVIKQAGLLEGKFLDKTIYYALKGKSLNQMEGFFGSFMQLRVQRAQRA